MVAPWHKVAAGGGGESAVAYSLAAQEEVDALLRALVAARARQDGLGDRWRGLLRVMGP